MSLRKWTQASRISVPTKTVLVGFEWRLARRPARSIPRARPGRWPGWPGSHWGSSIRSTRLSGPAGVSLGGTWRQASRPRTSPCMQYFMRDTGHPGPVPAPRWVEDGERLSAPPVVYFQGAVMVLKGRGVGREDPGRGKDGVLGGVVDGAVRVADIVLRDPRLEGPSPAVPPHVVEHAEGLHGGALGGHPELVGWQDAACHQAGLVVVFEQGGRELPHRSQIRERPAVGDGAVWHLLREVDEIRGMRLGHGRPIENVVDQIHDHDKLGVLQLSEEPVFEQIVVRHCGRGSVDDGTRVGDGGAGWRAKRGTGLSPDSLDAG